MIKTSNTLFKSVLLTLTLLLTSFAYAKRNECNFDFLTDDCKILHTNKAKIMLPDGTFIPNFNVLDSKQNTYTDKQFLQDQAEQEFSEGLEQILNDIDANKMSKKLKQFFLRKPGELKKIYQMQGNKESTQTLQYESISLPWPPTSAEAPLQRKMLYEVHDEIWKIFSPTQQEQLAQHFSKWSNAIENVPNSPEKDLKTYSAKRRAEVETLFTFAKNAIINTITQGRKESELSGAEREAVRKVDSIQFADPNSDTTKQNPGCQSLRPNAFYIALDHNFILCPTMMNLPNLSLLHIIAHEIGHSIDPCNAQFGTFQINRQNLLAMTQDPKQQIFLNHRQELTGLLTSLSINLSPQGITAGQIESRLKNDETLTQALKLELLTQISQAVPYDKYIFSDIYSCLIKDSSGNFRELSDADYEEAISLTVQNIAKNPPKKFNKEQFKEQLRSQIKKYPQCFDLNNTSQMQEVIADWIGTEVIAQYLLQRKPKIKSKLDQTALIAGAASSICEQKASLLEVPTAQSAASTIAAALYDNKDPHPHNILRINQILLKQPQIQNALGCKDTGVGKYCAHNPRTHLENKSLPTQNKGIQ